MEQAKSLLKVSAVMASMLNNSTQFNRPLASSKKSRFQNEDKCTTIHMEMKDFGGFEIFDFGIFLGRKILVSTIG